MSHSNTAASAEDRYAQRGVSSGKEEVHAAISGIDKGLFPKAFCKVVPDALTGSEDHCLVMHADGAGTKSALAWIYWKETGDLSVWKGIAQDALVMNLDDLLCVGATGPISFDKQGRVVDTQIFINRHDGTQFDTSAGREPLERDRDARGWRDRLNAAGLNVVHETVSRQNSDCSFSNYVALNDRRAYFNIEAVHGSRIQTGMVDKLMAVLGYRPVR